jgi:hypothetical protein
MDRPSLVIKYTDSGITISIIEEEKLYGAESVMPISTISFDTFNRMKSTEVEQRFGHTMLSLIENLCGPISPSEIYKSKTENILEEADKHIAIDAHKNDDIAQHAYAVNFLQKAIQEKNSSYLEEAELWFKRSAENGNAKSKHFLESVWPTIKEKYMEEFGDHNEE